MSFASKALEDWIKRHCEEISEQVSLNNLVLQRMRNMSIEENPNGGFNQQTQSKLQPENNMAAQENNAHQMRTSKLIRIAKDAVGIYKDRPKNLSGYQRDVVAELVTRYEELVENKALLVPDWQDETHGGWNYRIFHTYEGSYFGIVFVGKAGYACEWDKDGRCTNLPGQGYSLVKRQIVEKRLEHITFSNHTQVKVALTITNGVPTAIELVK